MTTRTGRLLPAVNDVLVRLGLQKVTTLGTTVAAQQVEDNLVSQTEALQADSWYFNTELDVGFPTSGLGFIELPENVISADITDSTTEVAVRSGRLYNLTDKTYVWSKATNLLTDPNDLDGAGWTDTFDVNNTTETNVRGPYGNPDPVNYLEDTDTLVRGTVSQDPTLVDGTRYRLDGYFRNGPISGSLKTSIRFLQGGQPSATLALRLDAEPPTLRTALSGATGSGEGGLMEQARITQLDAPLDKVNEGFNPAAALVASWCYVSGSFVYDASLGTPITYECFAHEDASALADMFVQHLQLTVDTTSTGNLKVVYGFAYDELPPAAQDYVKAMAALDMNEILGSNQSRTRLFEQRRLESWAKLQTEEILQADYNFLHSHSDRARFGSRHLSPLTYNSRAGSSFIGQL